jgi:hypothetical protein
MSHAHPFTTRAQIRSLTHLRLVPIVCPSFVRLLALCCLPLSASILHLDTQTHEPIIFQPPLYFRGARIVGVRNVRLPRWLRHVLLHGLAPATKPKPEKSVLDPERFLDLKLKVVEPYSQRHLALMSSSYRAARPLSSLPSCARR